MHRILDVYSPDMSDAIFVTPIDGWGYHDAIDGLLAPRFAVDITESGARVGRGIADYHIRGWRGTVVSPSSKYHDMAIRMTPRHVDWDGMVVVEITDGDRVMFSGMAETTGLECTWK
ncbi:MAG: hypothetical protein ACTHJR_16815 [Sphingomonas sp.]|uniref:hypothetical protein n=1 Tax=Sphingomonas sp. TaxID=28214 RepID=UPI003F7D07FF